MLICYLTISYCNVFIIYDARFIEIIFSVTFFCFRTLIDGTSLFSFKDTMKISRTAASIDSAVPIVGISQRPSSEKVV